jgi:hypothetical protein
MDNPEKMATQRKWQHRAQLYEENHKTIYVGHHYAQTNINNVNKWIYEPSYKQLVAKTNRK